MALETAQSRLDAVDSKSEPALHILSIVKAVDLICHLWQQYINMALLPLASSSVTARREMVQFNTQTINRIESATNSVLQKIADCEYSTYLHAAPTSFPHTVYSYCWMAFLAVDQTEEGRLQAQERRYLVCAGQHGALCCVL